MIIVRIWEDPNDKDRMTRTRLPGDHGDGQKALEALNKTLAEYPEHGYNAEHGYHWARDSKGEQYRFVISGAE